MKQTIFVDGSTLTYERKFCLVSAKSKMVMEEMIIISKDGKEFLRVPARDKHLLIQALKENMNEEAMDYYNELKSQEASKRSGLF